MHWFFYREISHVFKSAFDFTIKMKNALNLSMGGGGGGEGEGGGGVN